ncbi:GTPase-associated protein 1-related protein [Nocardiopsis terrae]
MGSPQLYYTSCEHGLSGCSGYQFNAATPGVDPRVLREVERFTVYEPPRPRDAGDADRHPVNLCYSPDLAGYPVLSRVVSSGEDPSGRPGNYFAHSLLLVGGGAFLPAEQWGAGFWASAPVTAPDLPGIVLPPGPLDRRRTAVWLLGRPEHLLGRLLAAVDGAIDGGPPVLLLADDEAAAHWVAALSHLLPPRRARAMSFATYSGNPEDSPVHVVAVPPHTDTRLLRSRFTVFDPGGEQRTGPARGAVPAGTAATEPAEASRPGAEPPGPDTTAVVSLLLATGVEDAPALWSAARPYSSGAERSLADWRPVLAAASLAEGSARGTGPDLGAVRAWLPGAVSWLAPERARLLIERLLDAGTGHLRDDELVRFRKAALDAGSAEITERLEGEAVRRCLERITAGSSAPPAPPVRSERVREAARDRVRDLLDGAAGRVPPPDRAAELLRWARTAGLVPPAPALARYGRGTVAAHLAAAPPGAEPDPVLARLVHGYEALRGGAAAGLAALPRPVLADLAAGPAGALFAEDRGGSSAVLRELRLLAVGDGEPLRLLRGVVALRQEARTWDPPGLAAHDLDEELLFRVWGPGQRPCAVSAVLGLAGERTLVSPGVGHWIAGALMAEPHEDEDGDWRRALHGLARHRLGRLLPEDARRLVDGWAGASAALAELDRPGHAEGAARLRPVAAAVLGGDDRLVAAVALRGVAARLLRWRPEHAAEALSDCAEEVFGAYCRAAYRRLVLPPRRGLSDLRRRTSETELAVRVFRTALALGAGAPPDPAARDARLLEQVLGPALRTWSRRETGRARRAFGTDGRGQEFGAWARSVRERGGGGGLFGRLRRGSRGA